MASSTIPSTKQSIYLERLNSHNQPCSQADETKHTFIAVLTMTWSRCFAALTGHRTWSEGWSSASSMHRCWIWGQPTTWRPVSKCKINKRIFSHTKTQPEHNQSTTWSYSTSALIPVSWFAKSSSSSSNLRLPDPEKQGNKWRLDELRALSHGGVRGRMYGDSGSESDVAITSGLFTGSCIWWRSICVEMLPES